MGYKPVNIRITTDYTEQELTSYIGKLLGIRNFTYQIEQKSLDARKKPNIVWQMRLGIYSKELKGGELPVEPGLDIPYRKRNYPVVVTGSGPAGFFAALVLQKAGFKVTIIERGSDVTTRSKAVTHFERTGVFDAVNNYAFGEGGAGTFSDGKLTSRSKQISKEKQFILSQYVQAGAPSEIEYLSHPHLGTDNLRNIVKNLRILFIEAGGEILFETLMEDVLINNQKVSGIVTSRGILPAGGLFVAPGHSAYETYRMLMRRGVSFHTKNFALGCRMEHPQEVINLAQWGKASLRGVKAAEYRITSPADGKHHVFSFCMCPGGMIVPAGAYPETNIVNGMSYYKRNGKFANAACVAGIHPNDLAGKIISPWQTLDLVESLEHQFYSFSDGYKAPACSINDFLSRKSSGFNYTGSYTPGVLQAPLWDLLPNEIVPSLQAGLADFIRKMKGFENGMLLGLESKTSAPIQVERDRNGKCVGFDNLFVIGEGSGFAGGIISSAADGVRCAMSLASA